MGNDRQQTQIDISERMARLREIWADFERELAELQKEHKEQLEKLLKDADQKKIKEVLTKLKELPLNNA